MKVCMICPEIGDSRRNAFIGGHVNNVIQLSKDLSARGHEITIITTPHRFPGNNLINNPISEYADVVTLPVRGTFSSFNYGFDFVIKSIKKVHELNKEKKFDIIHGHSGYTMLALLTSICAKISDLPSVHTIYCPIQVENGSFVKLFSNQFLSSLYLSRVNKVIAVTKNIKQSLISVGVAEKKIAEIPIGIDPLRYNPRVFGNNVKNDWGISHDENVLIFVGNSTNQKGILLLIESLNYIKCTFPKIKLFMALNMPIERYNSPGRLDSDMSQIFRIKDKIKLYNLEKNVIPLGLLENMPEYLAASDIFIAPFLNTVGIADHPTSMLEAMAIGRPVIATDVGGISELLSDSGAGILIKPNDISELTSAIYHLLSNRDLAKNMGKNGENMIVRSFRSDKVISLIESLYEEVISNYNRN